MNGGSAALRVDGGMSRNDWFLQRQADILGSPILKAVHGESTALGAAMLAGITAGLCDEQSLASTLGEPQRFEPRWTERERQTKMMRWRRAVQAVIALDREDEL